MKRLKSAKGALFTLLLVCLCLKVIAWVLIPIVVALLPYIVVGIILVMVIGVAWFRTTKL